MKTIKKIVTTAVCVMFASLLFIGASNPTESIGVPGTGIGRKIVEETATYDADLIEKTDAADYLYSITPDEIDLIALLTMAEAEGESELGKRLVIDTILNRMDSFDFPDTVTEVICEPGQFSPIWNGRIEECYVMDDIVELVKEELLERTDYDCVFFRTICFSDFGTPLFQEGNHFFSGK